jgi:predicted deacylase
MDNIPRTSEYITAFQNYEQKYPGPCPFSVTLNFKKHTGHIVLGAIVHGNEVGPLEGFLKILSLLEDGSISYGGKLTLFLGNVEAAQQGKRFLDYDLNRSFGDQSPSTGRERKRALELMPLLSVADVFFDFHQTIQPAKEFFYIFPMDDVSYQWARAAGGCSIFMTRRPSQSFSSSGMCTDEYVRNYKKPGITMELGKQGFSPLVTSTTVRMVRRILKAGDRVFGGHGVISIHQYARKNRELKWCEMTYKEPFSHPLKSLNPGFCNLDSVYKGQVMGKDETGKDILAPHSGFILFPKYPPRNAKGEADLPLPGELYVLATS